LLSRERCASAGLEVVGVISLDNYTPYKSCCLHHLYSV
jgi:hypothetical protein